MRAIILCAGRGSRLLPWTARSPKCLLPVQGRRPVLELQLEALAAGGVSEAVVVTGFGADQVASFLEGRPVPGIRTRTLHNPCYDTADNLYSCWLASPEMGGEFVLLNGDTLFQREVLERLLATARAPLTLAVNQKGDYDDDDMKVWLVGRQLRAVGKTLEPACASAESIGMMRFSDCGARLFREALDACMRRPEASSSYYLAAVNRMARTGNVRTVNITGLWWQEIDDVSDWVGARVALEPGEHRLGVIPAGRRRRLALRTSLAMLLAAGALVGRPASADPALPVRPDPSVSAESDPWLHGPSVRVYPIRGPIRPYVVGGGGVVSESRRLGISDAAGRIGPEPYGGRVGGGLDLRLSKRSVLRFEGSYLQSSDPVVDEGAGTAGLELRFRF